jgi:hypothetical protein
MRFLVQGSVSHVSELIQYHLDSLIRFEYVELESWNASAGGTPGYLFYGLRGNQEERLSLARRSLLILYWPPVH